MNVKVELKNQLKKMMKKVMNLDDDDDDDDLMNRRILKQLKLKNVMKLKSFDSLIAVDG